MNAYLVAVNLLVQANHCPESAIAGDDIASSIAGVSLPDNYVPDVSAFPLWHTGTVR